MPQGAKAKADTEQQHKTYWPWLLSTCQVPVRFLDWAALSQVWSCAPRFAVGPRWWGHSHPETPGTQARSAAVGLSGTMPEVGHDLQPDNQNSTAEVRTLWCSNSSNQIVLWETEAYKIWQFITLQRVATPNTIHQISKWFKTAAN